MEVLVLIGEARAAGLAIEVEGDTLIVSGPSHAAPLAQQLGQRKAEVIAAITNRAPYACYGSGRSRRLIGRGFPSTPSAEPPPSILASTRISCPACGQRPVLPELRRLTNGTCFDCWRGGAQP